MEIIRRGESSIVWPREFECRHCESLLRLDLDDIKRNTDYLGDFSSWYIDCPLCEEQPDVPTDWWNTIARMKNARMKNS